MPQASVMGHNTELPNAGHNPSVHSTAPPPPPPGAGPWGADGWGVCVAGLRRAMSTGAEGVHRGEGCAQGEGGGGGLRRIPALS